MTLILEDVGEILTMDDVDLEGRKVLLRIDINVPIDTETGRILDDHRLVAHSVTINELIGMGAAVVLTSHQGRPGLRDFVSLKAHAERLSEIMSTEVRFIDDVMGPAARDEIMSLKHGDVLLLENLRICSEELLERDFVSQSKTFMVSKLSPLFDNFVLDAFATSHRSQPSIVGFPMVLASCAGRVMEKEVKALTEVMSGERGPRIFILGGAKARDTLKIIEYLLRNGKADKILLAGLVSLPFLVARGTKVGRRNVEVLEEEGLWTLVTGARKVLREFGDKIGLPIDLAVNEGYRREVSLRESSKVDSRIMDVGSETVAKYSSELKEAGAVVFRGPLGVIEREEFREGTERMLKVVAGIKGFTVIGGGHLGAMLKHLGLEDKVDHVSTGGGALITFLSGEPLPALKALALSARIFR